MSDANTYDIEGKQYPRMTRVIDIISKPEFYRWYAKNGYEKCESIKTDRAAFGTRVHQEIQNILENKDVWYDNEEMRVSLALFKDWKEEHKLEPVALELTLHNDLLGIAGTCDYVGKIDDRLMLLDWKTSKQVYDTHKLQVAGYTYMYEQATGKELDGCGIIAIRDGKIREKYLDRLEINALLPVLLAASIAYRWKFRYKWEQTTVPFNYLQQLLYANEYLKE